LGHRGLHHLRDVTDAEGAWTARTGRLPRVMASLGNLAIGALRLIGHASIAAALRPNGRDPTARAPRVGNCRKPTARHLAGALELTCSQRAA
jgi:hypothetical protein